MDIGSNQNSHLLRWLSTLFIELEPQICLKLSRVFSSIKFGFNYRPSF
nr:MAG TPA: hypothetical protein [Caudoviricetes sp.]